MSKSVCSASVPVLSLTEILCYLNSPLFCRPANWVKAKLFPQICAGSRSALIMHWSWPLQVSCSTYVWYSKHPCWKKLDNSLKLTTLVSVWWRTGQLMSTSSQPMVWLWQDWCGGWHCWPQIVCRGPKRWVVGCCVISCWAVEGLAVVQSIVEWLAVVLCGVSCC